MNSSRKQFTIVVLSAIAVIVIGYGACWLASPRTLQPGDALGKYFRIQKGMTESEIVRIMCVPSGDYTSGPIEFPSCLTGSPIETYREQDADDEFSHLNWTWDDGSVSVWLDKDGVVTRKTYAPVWQPRSFLSRTGDWLASWRRR